MLSNFVGEYLVLQGTAIANFEWAIYASLGVILFLFSLRKRS